MTYLFQTIRKEQKKYNHMFELKDRSIKSKASKVRLYSELLLVWTPERRPPLYSGHFKMSQNMQICP